MLLHEYYFVHVHLITVHIVLNVITFSDKLEKFTNMIKNSGKYINQSVFS